MKAPLIPKLRGNFAEFLNESSLERLRILSSSTCVGLRYGHPIYSLEAFLGKCADQFVSFWDSLSPLKVNALDLPGASFYWLGPALPSAGWS